MKQQDYEVQKSKGYAEPFNLQTMQKYNEKLDLQHLFLETY